MKKFLIITAIILSWQNLVLADQKQGRFFEDQPDVNDDYQIHLIYFLAKNTKDKEEIYQDILKKI